MSDAKQRAALLKCVRGEHVETVKRTQALLKKQKKVETIPILFRTSEKSRVNHYFRDPDVAYEIK